MISLLTPQHGRIDAIARGSRRSKSRLHGAIQPFAYSQYVLRKKGDRVSVVQADLLESFYDLRLDYERLLVASAVMEVCLYAMQPGEADSPLFHLAYYALSFLSYGEMDRSDLWVTFLARFLDQQGYRPATTRCSRCGASTYQNASFHAVLGALCHDCGHSKGGAAMAPLSLEALRRMMALPVAQIGKIILPRAVRTELLEALPGYFLSHVGGNFKSALLQPAPNNG